MQVDRNRPVNANHSLMSAPEVKKEAPQTLRITDIWMACIKNPAVYKHPATYLAAIVFTAIAIKSLVAAAAIVILIALLTKKIFPVLIHSKLTTMRAQVNALRLDLSSLMPTLTRLDKEYQGLQQAMARMVEQPNRINYPWEFIINKISPIKFSPTKYQEIEVLQKHLNENYQTQLQLVSGHGDLSWQRVVWQDEKFLEFLADHTNVQFLFLQNEGNSVDLGRTNSRKNLNNLPGLMILGLACQRISYLATVAPNCEENAKALSNGKEKNNNKMMTTAEPWVPTKEYLTKLEKALKSIEQVLELKINPVDSDDSSRLIENASIAELELAFRYLIRKDKQVELLTGTQQKNSTKQNTPAYQPLVDECLAVMQKYSDFLKLTNGNHALALGCESVSHVLDARHLIAVLYSGRQSEENTQLLGPTSVTIEANFYKLLKDARNGTMEPVACYLIKVRLQQVLKMIYNNLKSLGLTDDHFYNAFQK